MSVRKFFQGRGAAFVWLGLVITALGVAIQGFDRWSAITALQLEHLSSSPIVEKSPDLSKLQVSYEGKEIESLYRSSFALANTGRKPIARENIQAFPHVRFASNGVLLDLRVESTSPTNVECELVADADGRGFLIECPLMNPGDRIQIGALCSGVMRDFKGEARIAGITELPVVDRAQELIRPKRKIGWMVYAAGFVCLMISTGLVAVFRSVRQERELQRVFLTKGAHIPELSSRQEYKDLIATLFAFATMRRRDRVMASITEALGDGPVTPQHRQIVENLLRLELHREDQYFGPAVLAVVIAVANGLFVYSELFG